MRYVLIFLVLSLLNPLQALAMDAVEWSDLSESAWWNPDDPRMIPHPPDVDHWYGVDCCGREDCRAFASALVTEHDDGRVTLELPPYADFPGYHLTFSREEVTRRPKNAASDAFWHFCFTLRRHIDSGLITAKRECAYPPAPNT